MDNNVMDLLGIPFVLHGRSKKGYDCYSLVIEFERRLGHNMYDLAKGYGDNNEKDLNDNVYNIIKSCKLRKTNELKYGNVVLFYDNKGRVCHIGALLNNKDFIHCDCEGVRVSNLDTYSRKGEIYEWLR